MADVAANLKDWSATASSNSPTDATTIGAGLADNLQAIQAVVRGDLATKGSDIASSAAPDVGAVPGLYHDLTGAVTVTGLGSTANAGIWKILQTDSTPVFKHSTALQMVGSVDYEAAAGDVLGFMCEAANQWRCMFGSPYAPPAGAMMDFAGTTAPSGWLACNGTAVSRTTYARLFAAISTTWGVGDGSTTFNLPNFSRRVAVGSGGSGTGTLGNAVGNTGGAETHTLTLAESPAHAHAGSTVSGTIPTAITGAVGDGDAVMETNAAASNTIPITATPSIASEGGGGAHNNMQPSAVVLKIIKT